MAIMHLSVKNGERGKGSAHAQYIEREGKYANREDVVCKESGNMPEWAAGKSLKFWQASDKHERANGRSYKEIEISLPRELTTEQQIELVREFTKNVLGDRHAYTWAIHQPSAKDGELNPHVHLMFSERAHDGIERTEEQYFKRYNPTHPEKGGAGKDRTFTHKSFVHAVRQEWSATVNHTLEKLNISARIDHRSYRDMNIDLESQNVKRLFAASENNEHTSSFDMTKSLRDKQCDNGERIIENPEIALKALTANSSTFTKSELEKFVFLHTDGHEQYLDAYNAVLSSPSIRFLEHDKHRYTTTDVRNIESSIIEMAQKATNTKTLESSFSERMAIIKIEKSKTFNNEQKAAFKVLTNPSKIAIVNGAAGTGKSYLLQSVHQFYNESGQHVIGAAIQGVTAQSMERDAGIESKTVASLLARLKLEQDNSVTPDKQTFNKNTVLVLDEAGMIGSQDMHDLLKFADMYDTKIRMVGDSYQLSAVAAGDAFRKLQQTVKPEHQANLNAIVRQKDEQHRQASTAMSRHDIGVGLRIHAKLGNIQEFETQQEARSQIVAQWAESHKANKTTIMLAYTNRDVNAMNKAARVLKRADGQLYGDDYAITTTKGKIALAQGDDIVFLKPNKDMGVLNGTRGRVEQVQMDIAGGFTGLKVKTTDGKAVQVDLNEYKAFNHAYASTIHKAQGVTVDNAYVLVSPNMNANLTYVASTRHRESLTVVHSREQFKTTDEMVKTLSKGQVKTYSTDFDVLTERNKSFERITVRETLFERMSERDVKSPSNRPKNKEVGVEQRDNPNELNYQARINAVKERHDADKDVDLQSKIDRLNDIEKSMDIPARQFSNREMVSALRQDFIERGQITQERELGTYGNSCRAGVGDYVKLEENYAKKEAGIFGRKTQVERGAELKIEGFELDAKTGNTWMNAKIMQGEQQNKIVRIDLASAQNFAYSDRYEKYLKSNDNAHKNVIQRLNHKEIQGLKSEIERTQNQRESQQKAAERMRVRNLSKQRDHDKGRGFSR